MLVSGIILTILGLIGTFVTQDMKGNASYILGSYTGWGQYGEEAVIIDIIQIVSIVVLVVGIIFLIIGLVKLGTKPKRVYGNYNMGYHVQPPYYPQAQSPATPSYMNTCSSCGQLIENNVSFCSKCGAKAVQQSNQKICGNCGKIMENSSKFCSECGNGM